MTHAEAGYRGACSQQITYSREEKSAMQMRAAQTRDRREVDPTGISAAEFARRVEANHKLRMAKVRAHRKPKRLAA